MENVPQLTPDCFVKTTVSEPDVMIFPAASFLIRVSVVVLPDVNESTPLVRLDCAGLTEPGITVIVGAKPPDIAIPSSFADIVDGVPAVVPVNTAE